VEVLVQDLFRWRRGIALPRQAGKEKQKEKAFSETNKKYLKKLKKTESKPFQNPHYIQKVLDYPRAR
jgi:hypothetical protein